MANKESNEDFINLLSKDVSNRGILKWLTQNFDNWGDFFNEEFGQIYEVPVNPETGKYTTRDSKDRRYYLGKQKSYSEPGRAERYGKAYLPENIAETILFSPEDSLATSEYDSLINNLLQKKNTQVYGRESFKSLPFSGDFRGKDEKRDTWNLLKSLFGRN
jgi:hypothetical protein